MNERIKAGADIHAGNGGYEIGTQEKYEAFVKVRNKSLARARIRELWEEAAKTTQGDSWEEQTKFMEKFAELIVRECKKAIDPTGDLTSISEAGWRKACMKMIDEHFRVEE